MVSNQSSPRPFEKLKRENMKKFALLAAVASIALAGCGQSVQPGTVGIKISSFGSNAGVQSQTLPVGYAFKGPGERIVEYPTITRNYSFAKAGDGDNKDTNEELIFADNSGLPMSADVQITMNVDPSHVVNIYQKYRLDFNDLLYGPVRSQVRSSIAAEASKVAATDMFSSQRAVVMQRALADVQARFSKEGIVVSDLQWLGNIRAPEQVIDAIKQRTQVEQQTQIAIQQKAKAEAEAAAKVATAEGDKKAKELEAEALNTAGGEKTLRKQWIDRWDGHLPQYIMGGNAQMLLNLPSKGD
jgi:regulator of protease activity HflC (stomatin/prohibitin superfamily)